MTIKKLSPKETENFLPMIWDVFLEYEAVNYPTQGKQAFWDAIHSEEYLAGLQSFGAFIDNEPVGIIATRNEGKHIALFFVKGAYHGKGIGKKLWNTIINEIASPAVTVHSSIFAAPIYRKLGFVPTGNVREDGGIRYVPMEYKTVVSEERHGDHG